MNRVDSIAEAWSKSVPEADRNARKDIAELLEYIRLEDRLVTALYVLWRDHSWHDEDCPGEQDGQEEKCTCGYGPAMKLIYEARKASFEYANT